MTRISALAAIGLLLPALGATAVSHGHPRLTVKRQADSSCGESLSTTQNSDSTYVVQQEPEGASGPNKAGLVEHGAAPDVPEKSLQRAEYSIEFEEINVLIDTDSFAVGFELTAEGIVLGTFYGSIKEGVSVEVKTDNINGKSELYLRNGNEVWHRVDLASKNPKETIEGDYKLTII